MFLRHFRSFSVKHGPVSLERSKNSNLYEINPRKPGQKSKHVILTLDPNKFAEKKQQSLHIGNLQSFRPHVSLLKHSSPVVSTATEYDVTFHNSRVIRLPYPPGTNAFLYYSIAPGKPRIAGELRLRVVSSNDQASFESGSDLLLTNGRVWSRPLYGLSKYIIPLYEKLREERFIPDDLHAALSNLPLERPRLRRGQILHILNDTFVVDFSKTELTFFVITEQGMERMSLHCHMFSDQRNFLRDKPYTGSALARFERSTLPVHNGTRTVVLRFLKIITPVKCVMPFYDGNICFPKEGELYRRNRSRNVHSTLDRDQPPVWSVDIDKLRGNMFRGLRLLWDA